MNLRLEIEEAYEYLVQRTAYRPVIGIILGTGYDPLANMITEPELYRYCDIPHFPTPSVEGHEGTLLFGKIHDKEVVIMKGRCHCYEGYSPSKVTIPVRVMKLLGVETIIITNCSEQANESIQEGDAFYPLKYRIMYMIYHTLYKNQLAITKDLLVEGTGSNIRSINRVINTLIDDGILEYKSGIISVKSMGKLEAEMELYN